jgi:hypothetical protein
MKKTITGILAAAAAIATISSAAYAAGEETNYFSDVDAYWDSVYTTHIIGTNGGDTYGYGNVNLNLLPYGLKDQGRIYTFCFYNNKLYYSTGFEGSDINYPARIYSCDIDGKNNRLLADNVEPWSQAFIIDNVLYYEAYNSDPWEGPKGYVGGVYKINLNNLSWKKIVTGKVILNYCDGDYAYYTIVDGMYNAAIDVNGKRWVAIDENSDECKREWMMSNVWIKGNNTYYVSGNGIYVRPKNGGDSRLICKVDNYYYYYDYGIYIRNITENYIYYSVRNLNKRNENWGYVNEVYRVSRW